jgi:hypothetical protein
MWPTSALSGVNTELPSPFYFEEAAKIVSEDQVAEKIVCGPDPRKHIEAIEKYVKAGFDHIYVHQVGTEQDGFMQFYRSEILGHFAKLNGHRVDSIESSRA